MLSSPTSYIFVRSGSECRGLERAEAVRLRPHLHIRVGGHKPAQFTSMTPRSGFTGLVGTRLGRAARTCPGGFRKNRPQASSQHGRLVSLVGNSPLPRRPGQMFGSLSLLPVDL